MGAAQEQLGVLLLLRYGCALRGIGRRSLIEGLEDLLFYPS
jgi:hypothetical protein